MYPMTARKYKLMRRSMAASTRSVKHLHRGRQSVSMAALNAGCVSAENTSRLDARRNVKHGRAGMMPHAMKHL